MSRYRHRRENENAGINYRGHHVSFVNIKLPPPRSWKVKRAVDFKVSAKWGLLPQRSLHGRNTEGGIAIILVQFLTRDGY